MPAIPFIIETVYGGWAKTEGMIACRGRELWLEFRTRDSLLGWIKSPVKQVSIALREFEDIELKRGFFNDTLSLRVNSLRVEEILPKVEDGQLRLRIKKRYRAETERLITDIKIHLTQHVLDRLQLDT